jgi:hypothetical protein
MRVPPATVVSNAGESQIVFKKIVTFLYELGRDKLYMKSIALYETYNFVVQTFSFKVIFKIKQSIFCQNLSFRYPDLDSISII